MNLGTLGGLGLMQARMQQRHFVTDVRTEHHDLRRLVDFSHRHAEGLGHGSVGEITLADAVVDVAAAQALGQACQQRTFFIGAGRVDQHAQVVALVGRQDRGGLSQGIGPADFHPLAVDLLQRRIGTVGTVQALVRITVAVGQPAVVDQGIFTRHGAQHFATANVQQHVRAQRVVVTQRFTRGQLPRAGLELEHLVGQRADRTDVDHVARQLGGQRLAIVGADLQVLTAVHATQLLGTGNFVSEAHATGALDAAGHLGGDQRAHVLVGHHALALVEAAVRAAVAQRHVLQLALAALVTDRAVQRMVDQQELHHRTLELQRLLTAGMDLHAVHHRGRTGRRRLGRLFHIHQAHAAAGSNGQLLVVAEARNRNAGLVGGVNDHRTLGHDQGATIDLDGHVIRRHICVYRLRAHASAASTFLPSTIE